MYPHVVKHTKNEKTTCVHAFNPPSGAGPGSTMSFRVNREDIRLSTLLLVDLAFVVADVRDAVSDGGGTFIFSLMFGVLGLDSSRLECVLEIFRSTSESPRMLEVVLSGSRLHDV